MTIKATYGTIDEVPEPFRELFEERGGAYHLTKIEGIKTEADIARVTRALDAERQAHAGLRTQFSGFLGDRKLEDVQAMLDRIPELETLANSKVDPNKLEELAEARIRTKLTPLERQIAQLTAANAEKDAALNQFVTKEKTRTIHDAVRQAATAAKVIPHAQEDVLMLAERLFEVNSDGTVTTKDGLDASTWLTDMAAKRPHWWPASQGGGAGGSGSGSGFPENPWSAAHWNMTKQGQILTQQGQAKAEMMARAAGTTVGGPRPKN